MNARHSVSAVIFCAGLVTGLAEPAQARPKFWSWQAPQGTAASNTDIVKMIRVSVGWPPKDGDDAADDVCDEIASRSLTAGNVAIVLQDFAKGDVPAATGPCPSYDSPDLNNYIGSTALYFHEDDALANTSLCEYWRTLWQSNGIAETQAWVSDFITQYQVRQGITATIPDPDRFHFDEEMELAACCSIRAIAVFDEMKNNDARWNSEDIPGFTSQTLDDLYTAAGTPQYRLMNGGVDSWWGDSYNATFVQWYKGVANQAVDGAMNEAAYTPLKDGAAFPGALCSNYNKSLRIDGVAGVFIDNGQGGVNGWSMVSWQGSGDLQAPNLYVVDVAHMTTAESTDHRIWDASMRVNRNNVEACIHSNSGGHSAEMCPWIPICGDSFPCGDGTRGNYPVSRDDLRRLLALLRSIDVTEFIFWNNNAANVAANWDRANVVLDHVWGATVSSVSIATGSQSGGGTPSDLVEFALRDPLVVTPSANATEVQTILTSSFASQPCRLRVVVEASVSSGALTQTVSIWDYTNSNWDTLTAVNATPTDYEAAYNNRIYEDANGETDDHISNTGEIKVRVQHTSISGGAHSEIDLVQLVGLDRTRYAGDTNDDYAVNTVDLLAYLGSSGLTVWPGTRGDVSGDGTVNTTDLTTITGANYGTSAPACP